MGMIGELIQTISTFVPWWILAIAGLLVAGLAAPGYLVGLKVKKVKALMRKTVRAEGEQRTQLQRQAWEVAKGNGDVLVALVKEADKLNQPRLRDRAMAALRKLGTHPDEVHKLSRPSNPHEDKRHGHPLEAAAAIRTLMNVEAWEAAQERLDEARARFPGDEGLQSLGERLQQERGRSAVQPSSGETEPR